MSKKEKSVKSSEKKARRQDRDAAKLQASESLNSASNKHRSISKKTSNSPFVQTTCALYLPLSPNAYNFPLTGLIAEHISPNIMTYFRPLEGILLAFSNPRISEHPTARPPADTNDAVHTVLTRSIDENAVTYVWFTAEFVVFRPEKGTVLEGELNLSNETLLGLVCYNYFNAAIDQDQIPSDWKWDGDGNQWLDTEKKPVQGKLQFKVIDFEVTGVESMTIKGTMI